MKKEKILIVDNNEQYLKKSENKVKKLGHTCFTTSSAINAIQLIYHQKFDLVFMELNMPLVDGFTATKMIRTLPNNQGQLPIIGLSDTNDEEDVVKAFASGMDNFILKPLTPENLSSIMILYCEAKLLSRNLSKKIQNLP